MAKWIEKGYTGFGYLIENTETHERIEFDTYEEAREYILDSELQESVKLARSVGVPEDKILHNMEEIDKFFQGDSGE